MDADEALHVIDGAVATDLEPRTVRAITECMTVLDCDRLHTYEVYSESGRQYRVNAASGECTCPDYRRRDVECKHRRRVALEEGGDRQRWADVQTELGTTILGIDQEIDRLQGRIRELEQAKRALGRATERIEQFQSSNESASSETPVASTPADD